MTLIKDVTIVLKKLLMIEKEIYMKKADVSVGNTYIVKVSGKLARVKLTNVCRQGGWMGVNLDTNRSVRIKTGGRLRRELVG
jgi:hypothetical protein